MQNDSPSERLRDAVVQLNEHARWNRFDVALQHVAPEYQGTYSARHAHWGKQIQVAEMEIMGVEAGRKLENAISRVQFSWYAIDSTMVNQTALRQLWKKSGRSFVLVGEMIDSGAPGLLLEKPPGPLEAPNQ